VARPPTLAGLESHGAYRQQALERRDELLNFVGEFLCPDRQEGRRYNLARSKIEIFAYLFPNHMDIVIGQTPLVLNDSFDAFLLPRGQLH